MILHLEDFYSFSVALQQGNAQNFLAEMKAHEQEIEQFDIEDDDEAIIIYHVTCQYE